MAKANTPKDVEVEWQFDALDLRPAERWFSALSGDSVAHSMTHSAPEVVLSAVRATPRPAERLVDTYFDTADWRIGRSGHVLRVRQRGGRAEATLKGLAQSTGGLRRRLEVTEPLPADGVAALGIQGPVGWRLRALVGKRPLQAILEVRTRRRPYDLQLSEETVAEAALDETTIVVGDDLQPVRLQRVEVEVEPAWVERLTPMVDTLVRECGLQPAALSKFEAGLLAAGLRIPPPPDLGPVSFNPNPSIGEVAFAVLRRSFSGVLAHETGTRLGEDPEELHDMRVATRRTRAALSLFEDVLPVRGRHVRTELGWLADALGTVRDLDVQLERVEEWTSDVIDEDRAALTDLAALLSRQRQEARRTLLACLDSARYERLAAGFTVMLRQGPSRRSPAARATAASVVPGLIAARHRSATKAARRAQRSGDADDFHSTRIRVKRLRYALEFVSEIYDKRTAKYVRHVVRLQDALGLMQDARVAAARLHDLATAQGSTLSPTTVFVMGGVTERYRNESERLARKVPGLLHELRGPEWRRLTALMERRRLELGAEYRWPGSVAPTTARTSPAPDPRSSTSPTPAPSPTPARRVPDPPAAVAPVSSPLSPGTSPGQAPVSGPEPPTPEPQTPDPLTPEPQKTALTNPDPGASHPAANRPGPDRLVPTPGPSEVVQVPEEAPDQRVHQAVRPSSNGESPHPDGP